MSGPARRAVVVVSLILWALAVVTYIGALLFRHQLGDLGCESAPGSSVYGHASWQWWPPGTRCTYPTHVVASPARNGLLLALLIFWPLLTFTAVAAISRAHRQRSL